MNETDDHTQADMARPPTDTGGMRLATTAIEPVRKQRTVPLTRPAAFELFTVRMGTWWPLASHSLSENQNSTVRFEEHVGGRVVEVTTDGDEYPWADVIAWDPPHRFVLAWHPSSQPVAATILEVRFGPTPGGGTTIDLIHRGWEELGDESGPTVRDDYSSGWDHVLAPFTSAASAAGRL